MKHFGRLSVVRFSVGRRGGLRFANLKFVSDSFVNGCEEGEDAVERSIPGFRRRFAPEDLPLRTGAALRFIRHQVEEALRMLAKMERELLERRLTGCRQASDSLLKPGAHAAAPGLALILLPAYETARKHMELFFIGRHALLLSVFCDRPVILPRGLGHQTPGKVSTLTHCRAKIERASSGLSGNRAESRDIRAED